MHENLMNSHSLNDLAIRNEIEQIVSSALLAVDPDAAVRRSMRIDGHQLLFAEKIYNLDAFRRIIVIGFGKAGYPMSRAVAELLASWKPRGIVIVKDGHTPVDRVGEHIVLKEAGHPIPDQRCLAATREIIHLLAQLHSEDLVICLISGGGSALFTAPASGLTLSDLQHTTNLLLKCGANIAEINQVRKHLDIVKGGGLARLIAPAQGITLILSDVIGDPLESIASGPTVADPSTFFDAMIVLSGYDLLDQIPRSVLQHIQSGASGLISETAKPGDPGLDRITNKIIGSNYLAAQAACNAAKTAGFEVILLTTYLQGEACQTGRVLGQVLKQVALTGEPARRPAVFVAGGETTVTVHGDGLGGRNLEVALGAVSEIASLRNVCLVTFATDGGDGPTDAAGAVVTGDTYRRGTEIGLIPEVFLDKNDSYHYFASLADLLKPGPTLTNVNDLAFCFAW